MRTTSVSRRCRITQIVSAVLIFSLLAGCVTTTQTARAPSPAPPPPPVQTKPTGQVVGVKKFLPVRGETSLKAKETGRLYAGDKVVINEEQGEWLNVTSTRKCDTGLLQGWVLAKYVEIDKAPPLPPPPQATAPQGEQQGKAEKKDLTGMKARTMLEGGFFGAALGAGLGALSAALSGGSISKGAIIGAAAGAAGGLIAGHYVANKKAKFATEEAYLEACIIEARQYGEEARSANDYLQKYIADTQNRIEQLKAQIRTDRTKKEIARAQVQALNQKSKKIDELIKNLEGEVKAQEQAISGAAPDSPKLPELKQEVEAIKQEIVTLKAQRDQLMNLTTEMNSLTV